MSRATSIAGVRPLGWLARLRAHRSCLVWACPSQLLGGDGAGAAGLGPMRQSQRWARERAIITRSGARPRVVQTDTFARAQMMATGRGPSALVVARRGEVRKIASGKTMSCTARFWNLRTGENFFGPHSGTHVRFTFGV